MNSHQTIYEALVALCEEHGTIPSFTLDQPEDALHGDYATNIAFPLSKALAKSPKETAELVIDALRAELTDVIEKIEVAGPGFINFFLKDDIRTDEAETVAMSDIVNVTGKGKVLVEYTDPNCFKVFHVGHLMANTIGEATARLYEASGYEVMRVCYPSDIGRNVAMGVWGVMQKESEKPSTQAILKEKIEFLGACYAFANTAFETDEKAKEEIIEVNKAIYAGSDAKVMEVYAEGRALSLEYFDALYVKLGTTFDAFIYESEVADPGLAIVKANMGTIFEESEGAIVYKGEQDGLHTRVFVNSVGLPTYETKDLGNYEKKLSLLPEASALVTITAAEQNDYFKVVNKVEEKIHPELTGKLIHISHGMLRLPTGKMSSRTGNVIGGEDLLDQVTEKIGERIKEMRVEEKDRAKLASDIAVGAVKFSILKQAPGKDTVFDFEKSLSFEGDSGPYLQYTHARLSALLDKAHEAGIEMESYSIENPERELEQVIIGYTQTLEKAYKDLGPHHIVQHLLRLTRAFNNMYGRVQIVNVDDKEKSAYYVMLSQAVKNIVAHGLYTLGIVAPERM
ncbi:MAG: arginine--tRNA ligase [Candidatus Paceibacterota bacterium]